MKIHEYQGKEIFRQYSIPIPHGGVAFTPQEAEEVSMKLKGPIWVVKAQIYAGGRGKGGGVKIAHTTAQVKQLATEILGMQLVTPQTSPEGQKVRRLYVEEGVNLIKEYYLSVVTDRASQKIAIIGSQEGGVNIEEVAHLYPDKIIKLLVDPLVGIDKEQAKSFVEKLGWQGEVAIQGQLLLENVYKCFMEKDASLVEINPLGLDQTGRLIALDAKFNFDSNALFRHPEIVILRDLDEEDPAEIEASKSDLAYISLDGNIGCLVNGAGLAMATMDTIKLYGASPANFLDVGGGATAEKVTEAFKIMLKNPKVKAILVNIFGGIMRCDTIAAGVITACHEVQLKVPLIIRLKGTNEQLARDIMTQSGLSIILVDSMSEAARKAAELVNT
ncbi:MAG: ADP-forming succinate--CoA ligase subunit beta [Gammaproteobacteria bacterium]|nr:ADP-forming succinate--CoA ligase subunit beta [Gammaproteobacteria bacterium]